MGIRYACASLSESALKHHLRGYFAATNGRRAGLLQSRDIAKTFLYALRTLSFGGSKRDISTLLQLITGDAGPDTPNLHQVLCWAQGEPGRKYVGVYLSLLVHARDRTVRHDIWNQYLQLLNDPTFSDWTSAYTYAETLLEVGEVSEAQTVLAQFSKCVGNRLPGISSFRGLQKFLRVDAICETLAQIASENELKSLLLTEIGHIEKRLGLKWSKNKHKGLSQAGVVGDKPILTIDGDSPGLESPERLLAEIQDWGGSKFAADLSQVADTLDDLEGELVPMAVTDWPNADMELYWAIHRSPVELCSESRLEIPDSQKVSASNLGLVKVTRSSNESLFAFEPPLHLMQLGYLLAKRSPPDDKESGGEAIDTSSQLHETGYLVTWDRVSGIFVLVFAGKGHGRIAPTTEFSTLAAPLGCATIIPIPPQIDACDVSKYRFPKYRLELDPGLDLGFDTRT
ncbi:uncharacterized protein BDV17DRAFT_287787 [Aspergillus undulatus]|uniref:uncharacterized protein n=1 Tax=Aspergillus undulatus TaxID=1810928 RepID=UPI003CCD69C7